MSTTLQHNEKSWIYACAWMNRDTTCVDEDAPDEIRFGLHPAADATRASSDCLAGISVSLIHVIAGLMADRLDIERGSVWRSRVSPAFAAPKWRSHVHIRHSNQRWPDSTACWFQVERWPPLAT